MTSLAIPPTPTAFDPKNWGKIVDFKTIERARIPTQGPETWRVFPQGTFIQMIEQAFDRHGFITSEPVHYMAPTRKNAKIKDQPEHSRFLTMYGIAHPGLPDSSGLNWESSWQNSYDMSMSAGGALGRRIQVCSNGMIIGTVDAKANRKHTVGIDRDREGHFESIYSLVDGLVGGLLRRATIEMERIEGYKQAECTDNDARYVIMEAAKRDVIGDAATMRVLKHWEEPEHPEFKDRNVWSLENAFTSNDRGQSVLTQASRFSKLYDIIEDRFSLTCSDSLQTTEDASDF